MIRDILLDNKYISEIEIKQNGMFCNKSYKFVIYCNLEVYVKWIPIVIGIPKDWEISLFDFYWNGEFPFIPHIDKNGKFCLYHLEGALIDANFHGLLNQCIDRARELVKNGETGNNKEDFLTEFDSYFILLPGVKIGKVAIPKLKDSRNIKFHEKLVNNRKQNETYVEYISRQQNTSYYSSSEPEDFKTWGITGTQQNGIYLYIEPNSPIYPPKYSNFDGIKFINELFKFVDKKAFNKLKLKCGNKLFVIFEIKQDEINTNCCGFIIENPVLIIEDKVKFKSFNKLVPLLVDRIDTQYLTNRTSFSTNKLEDKSFLIIGCGSIGGYVFHNLIKSGCKNITIVDNDRMSAENIYRHFLGIESVGCYKTIALEKYAKNTISEIKIKSITKKIEDAISDCKIELNDYDYIISATGNHIINLWLNKFIIDNKIKCTVFYIWNEVLDIGCHVALINSEKYFDYRNLFGRDENGELFDLTSFAMKGQTFTKSYSGCVGTFIPYGSTISLKSSLLFIDMLKQDIEGRIKSNVLCSEKGDDYYLKKAGFKISDRYKNQQNRCIMVNLEDLEKENY